MEEIRAKEKNMPEQKGVLLGVKAGMGVRESGNRIGEQRLKATEGWSGPDGCVGRRARRPAQLEQSQPGDVAEPTGKDPKQVGPQEDWIFTLNEVEAIGGF